MIFVISQTVEEIKSAFVLADADAKKAEAIATQLKGMTARTKKLNIILAALFIIPSFLAFGIIFEILFIYNIIKATKQIRRIEEALLEYTQSM